MATTVAVELTEVSCWCGITFAVPENCYSSAKRTGHAIYCPTGHEFVYTSEVDKLKKEITQLKDARDRALRQRDAAQEDTKAEERSHAATKGQLTKAKKRAHRGVCQHCNRSFVDVARHVATKHPEALEVA